MKPSNRIKFIVKLIKEKIDTRLGGRVPSYIDYGLYNKCIEGLKGLEKEHNLYLAIKMLDATKKKLDRDIICLNTEINNLKKKKKKQKIS